MADSSNGEVFHRWRSQKDADTLNPTRRPESDGTAAPAPYKAVVLFYYAPHDPYSRALRPVMECLPKFFPPSVLFFAVDHSRLPTTMQLNNGILGTPTIRLLRGNREASATSPFSPTSLQ